MEEIRFISHSCISVKVGKRSLLCDPWFFGRVFDNSWSHIIEPDPVSIDLKSISYIWISHEHPDHFSIPTLKYLKEKVCDDVTIIYRKQANKNVVNFLNKLGFKVIELEENTRMFLRDIGHITSFHRKSDSALLIETKNSTILNLNDCMLGNLKCNKILNKVGNIDFLFCQFSIAGYSGNPDDKRALRASQKYHTNKAQEYLKKFSPTYFVPFASFVCFCTRYNNYLNKWRNTVNDITNILPKNSVQVVFNGDILITEQSEIQTRNRDNLKKWADASSTPEIKNAERPTIKDDDVMSAADEFSKIFASWPIFSYPKSITIRLLDKDYSLFVDFCNNRIAAVENELADAAISSYSFIALTNNPWGADTLNISGECAVYNTKKWRWLLFCKHFCYKPVTSLHIAKYIPRLYSLTKF